MKFTVCLSVLVGVFLTLPCDASPGVVECDACSCYCTSGSWVQDSTPSTNGCGANNFQVIVGQVVIPDGFQDCCTEHDTCYGSCGKSKSTCDNEFCACMSDVCDSMSWWARIGCVPIKGTLCIGIKNSGCDAYTAAQKNRCRCT